MAWTSLGSEASRDGALGGIIDGTNPGAYEDKALTEELIQLPGGQDGGGGGGGGMQRPGF